MVFIIIIIWFGCVQIYIIKFYFIFFKITFYICSLFEILQTLYFSIYGLVDIKHFEIKQPHDFTQWVGKTMFGTYSAIMIIVLINMLIAMLSASYQIISVSILLCEFFTQYFYLNCDLLAFGLNIMSVNIQYQIFLNLSFSFDVIFYLFTWIIMIIITIWYLGGMVFQSEFLKKNKIKLFFPALRAIIQTIIFFTRNHFIIFKKKKRFSDCSKGNYL